MLRKWMSFVLTLTFGVQLQAQTEPEHAPKNSLLVLSICTEAWFKGGYLSKPENEKSRPYREYACRDIRAIDMLAPGEYRTFIHLIGPAEEYTVSCLGHLSYSGWAGHYNASKDCVLADFDNRNVVVGTNPYEWGKAFLALPKVGSYIPALWSNDHKTLTVVFSRHYKDKPKSFKFQIVNTGASAARMLAPGDLHPGEYACPNGELIVAGVRKCRPE